MELDGRVVVITRGMSQIGLALAAGCQKEGAIVVLSDTDENSLNKMADETGIIPIAGDTMRRPDIKSLVDKTRHRLGRIDLFVCNASLDTLGTTSTNCRDMHAACQSRFLSEMYAIKYMLPQWINRKDGYFLNIIPDTGLFGEHNLGIYSTLKHPSLSFAERVAASYRNIGVKVSVICSAPLMTMDDETGTNNKCDALRLQNLTEQVIVGIRKERFMIFLHTKSKIADNYQRHLRQYEMSRNITA